MIMLELLKMLKNCKIEFCVFSTPPPYLNARSATARSNKDLYPIEILDFHMKSVLKYLCMF